MVKVGFTRAYATSLQRIIAINTNNRFKAFLSGMGVTAILQSSTATAMICASFASKNVITTSAGLAVVIGADVSTTLVAQILTFDLSWLMPALLFSGVFMHHLYDHGGRRKHIARALIGLGLILLSLSMIKHSALPLSNSATLPIILAPLEKEPLLALIFAALITWMLHSSLASVLLIASFAASGLITMKLGLLLVLGANLGGALIPFVMSLSMDASARRITTGNLLMRASTIVIIVPFLPFLLDYISSKELTADSREIIHFHMGFNILLAILFMPFIDTLNKICIKLQPVKDCEQENIIKPRYLDNTALDTPTIALAGAAQETLRIAKVVENMFVDSMTALKTENEDIVKRVKEADDKVDTLHTAVKLYLTRVTEEALDPKESDRFVQILTFSTNLEHIGDIIESSLLDITMSKIKNQNRFSKEGFKEIQDFHQTILKNMKIAQAIFMSEDPKLAKQLVEGKKSVREAAQRSSQQHFQRLRDQLPETIATSSLHTDIIRDYRRVNSYITSVAYAILDNAAQHKSDRKEV